MWTEKYRPKTLNEVVGQEEIVNHLIGFTESKEMPHLLFSGRAGVGKTTCAHALINDILGEFKKGNFIELNASDARGIDEVRVRVKNFARLAVWGDVPFKIVILDEADNMTPDAQHALRRVMEKYDKTCRFILTCNYSSRIIEPIQSRCSVFRFKNLTDEVIGERVSYIGGEEGLSLTNGGIQAIVQVSDGDLRKAVNVLQTAGSFTENIDEETVYLVASRARPAEIEELIVLSIQDKDFGKARKKIRDLITKYGMSGGDIVRQIHRFLLRYDGFSNEIKLQALEYLGTIDYRIMEGASDDVQLSAFIAKLILLTS